MKSDADQKVIAADASRSAAQARQVEIEQLIADQSAEQRTLEGMKDHSEAEQVEIDAQRAVLAADLERIIAQQCAAEVAARAAAAAGRPAPPPVPELSGAVARSLFGNPGSPRGQFIEYGRHARRERAPARRRIKRWQA
ncbi:hypothetical protein [Pengzhenrongella phosphoraccumulans]|uniref:hypothetical protein n=1 Tax=Pengzhenrongella phosphoraccumulans TaxID=3114394 RepID=UPI00388DB07C